MRAVFAVLGVGWVLQAFGDLPAGEREDLTLRTPAYKKDCDEFPDGKLFLEPKGSRIACYLSSPREFPEPVGTLTVNYDAVLKGPGRYRFIFRVRDGKGNWTRWHRLRNEDSWQLPGESDQVQWAVVFHVSDTPSSLTVHGVRVFGTPSPAWVAGEGAAFGFPVEIARPEIVSREAWGAKPPKEDYVPIVPVSVVVHHTWEPAQAGYTGAATIRGIQDYHMYGSTTGWIDIGYHYLIGPEGKIFAGRPPDVRGAHCPPNVGVGISVIGNYDPGHDPFTEASRQSLIRLLAWVCWKYKINPKDRIFGHRDFSPKSCPGETIYSELPALREKLRELLGLPTW